MNKEILIILLIMHVLASFYFITNQLPSSPDRSYKKVVTHSFGYLLVFILPFLFLEFDGRLLFIGLILSASYFLISSCEYGLMMGKIYNRISNKAGYHSMLFFVKQFLQLIIISLLVYYWFKPNASVYMFNHFLLTEYVTILKWILVILLLMKPSNVIFKTLFGNYKPADLEGTGDSHDTRKAGSKIGSLERILMVICIAIGQFTALGLIFTAKSVARYDKISKNSEFAEYYLLGTFSSILFTVIWYLLSFQWL